MVGGQHDRPSGGSTRPRAAPCATPRSRWSPTSTQGLAEAGRRHPRRGLPSRSPSTWPELSDLVISPLWPPCPPAGAAPARRPSTGSRCRSRCPSSPRDEPDPCRAAGAAASGFLASASARRRSRRGGDGDGPPRGLPRSTTDDACPRGGARPRRRAPAARRGPARGRAPDRARPGRRTCSGGGRGRSPARRSAAFRSAAVRRAAHRQVSAGRVRHRCRRCPRPHRRRGVGRAAGRGSLRRRPRRDPRGGDASATLLASAAPVVRLCATAFPAGASVRRRWSTCRSRCRPPSPASRSPRSTRRTAGSASSLVAARHQGRLSPRSASSIALIFIGLPFVVRTVQPVLEELDREVEEAAATLGATPLADRSRGSSCRPCCRRC